MKNLKVLLIVVLVALAGSAFAQSIDEGKKFIYYERFKSAKNVFEKILASNSNNEEAAYWLGQAEIGLENLPAAKTLYQNKLSGAPNSPLIIAGMGHVALLEGNTQDARSRFETAISLSQGKSIPVLNAVGFANSNVDAKNGDAAYAKDQLTKATQLKNFKDADVLVNLGDAYRKLGDGGSALQSYNAALAINPNHARASYRIGKLYQTQGNSQEDLYLKYYNDAIAKDAAYAPVYGNLFNYYYYTNVKLAAEYLDKLLINSDDDPKACSYRASIKYAQGLFNDAISKADECIKLGGATPYANLYGIKALAYNRLKDSLNAKSSYEEYFKRQSPDKIGAGDYASYATILLKFPGNESTAGNLVDKAVALDSIEGNRVNYLKALAQAYDNQKLYKEAGLWYNKVLTIKKNPSNIDLYNAGYAYLRAGDYTTATQIFTQYTNKYPQDVFGYYMIGKSNSLLDSTGVQGLAVPAYQKVIEIGEAATDKEKVKVQLATAYKFFIEFYYNVKKDQATALQYVEKALVLEPNDSQLMTNKDFITKNDPNAAPKKPAKPATPAKPSSKTPTPPKPPKPAKK